MLDIVPFYRTGFPRTQPTCSIFSSVDRSAVPSHSVRLRHVALGNGSLGGPRYRVLMLWYSALFRLLGPGVVWFPQSEAFPRALGMGTRALLGGPSGPSWGPPGALGDLLGPSWEGPEGPQGALLGPSWGPPGRALLGGGPPGGPSWGPADWPENRGKQRKVAPRGVSRPFSREEIVTFPSFGGTLGSRT